MSDSIIAARLPSTFNIHITNTKITVTFQKLVFLMKSCQMKKPVTDIKGTQMTTLHYKHKYMNSFCFLSTKSTHLSDELHKKLIQEKIMSTLIKQSL